MIDSKVLSGDSHIDLRFMPENTFLDNAPAGLRDRMPHIEETEQGLRWLADGCDLGVVGTFVTETQSTEMNERTRLMVEGGFFEDQDIGWHPTNVELRLRDQDKDGIEGEVMYGLLRIGQQLSDSNLITEIFKLYNDWVANFCKQAPGRFAALACIPSHDPDVAAEELRRAASIGLHGADFGVNSVSTPIYHGDWDPLWKASHDTGLPISFHTTGLIPMRSTSGQGKAYDPMFHDIRTVLFQLSGAEFLTSIVLSGACERFPNFKFVLGECGIGWIPYVLDRMDHEAEHAEGLKIKPSEYWERQGASTYQNEGIASQIIPMVGEDNVMWGSDYPHPDGTWPDSRKYIASNLKTLDNPTVFNKVIYGNTKRLYGFS